MSIIEDRFSKLAAEKMQTVSGGGASIGSSVGALADIFRHREMLGLLVRRDLKSRYKDSALGFVWTLIRPLTQLLIYYVVMGKFLGAERGIPDFAIFVFAGLTAYGLFSEIVAGGTGSIVGNSGLIKKIYLPREVFPLASVGSALFNFAIQLGILLIATIVLGRAPLTPDIWYFFPSLLILVIYGTAFGLLFAATNVYLRDIQYLVEVGLMILMWASPVVYSWSMAGGILAKHHIIYEIYTNNPLTLAVLGFQRAFWIGGQAGAVYPAGFEMRMLIAILVGAALIVVFQRVFARLQGNFAQEL